MDTIEKVAEGWYQLPKAPSGSPGGLQAVHARLQGTDHSSVPKKMIGSPQWDRCGQHKHNYMAGGILHIDATYLPLRKMSAFQSRKQTQHAFKVVFCCCWGDGCWVFLFVFSFLFGCYYHFFLRQGLAM